MRLFLFVLISVLIPLEELFLDPFGYFLIDLGIGLQIGSYGLLALADLFTVVGEPGTGFIDDAGLYAQADDL